MKKTPVTVNFEKFIKAAEAKLPSCPNDVYKIGANA